MKSCDKLETLDYHFDKTYAHQTFQGFDFLWGVLIRKTTRLFDHMIAWHHVTNQKPYILLIIPILSFLVTMVDKEVY